MSGMSNPGGVSTKLQKIADLAKGAPDMVITSLSHHIDVAMLYEAHRKTRRDSAVGLDKQTKYEYESNLESNLESLLNRFKSGTYKAPPVKRAYIPKNDGKERRPIGIPTYEDKVLQRAIAMVLEAVYEQDFLPSSYGFRPERSAHNALEDIWKGTMDMGGSYVVEVDIRKFFDTLRHSDLRAILDQRVRDGVVRRAIDKWLKAGVLEEGMFYRPEDGTPQGGVISPLLANIYLHEVLDKWFEYEVKPRLRGRGFLVRYADDFVLAFSVEQDAREVYLGLHKRFAQFGLKLHPEKTRVLDFKRPGKGNPEFFDFLAFRHYWAKSRKGHWVVKRKTAKSRLARALVRMNVWCRSNRHESLKYQHLRLCQKLTGYFAYFGITGNSKSIGKYYYQVKVLWRKWLNRRSQRSRMDWGKFNKLL
ncbi:MAG: group II intron reverse transcriptase/maturase, partial [Desulfovermiculus sp.]|nr:group II intron reverse transcriptase/maturase [Desulfovermiculus sp.]